MKRGYVCTYVYAILIIKVDGKVVAGPKETRPSIGSGTVTEWARMETGKGDLLLVVPLPYRFQIVVLLDSFLSIFSPEVLSYFLRRKKRG
jgi:hypothetical protein